jgi:hypothetical protein
MTGHGRRIILSVPSDSAKLLTRASPGDGKAVSELAGSLDEAFDLSPATVKREWPLARAWLRRELD